MEFKEPFRIYTAASNVEAHVIVDMLEANGIPAFADEDQSGVSLCAFGPIGQFHRPNVWIDKSTTDKAVELIRDFEERKRERQVPGECQTEIEVECEECGRKSYFPDSLDGTTQECTHCNAFVDVGKLDWDEDVGEPEE